MLKYLSKIKLSCFNYQLLGQDQGILFVEEGVMCCHCGKVLSTVHVARRHVKEIHGHNEQQQCEICLKFFKNERQKKNHIKCAHGISATTTQNLVLQPLLPLPIPSEQAVSISSPPEDVLNPLETNNEEISK